MHWDGYTEFSVASGIAMIAAGLLAFGMSIKDRFWALVIGAAFLGYGIYVAHQTSGTWTFPAIIFVIPFGVVGYLIFGWYTWYAKRHPRSSPQGRWAADPTGQHSLRWHDGTTWTEHVHDQQGVAGQQGVVDQQHAADQHRQATAPCGVEATQRRVLPAAVAGSASSPRPSSCARCGADATGKIACGRCGAPIAASTSNGG